jgi:hypothetical protein
VTEGIYAYVTRRLVDEAASALGDGSMDSSRMTKSALLR